MTDEIVKRLRERVDFGRDGGMTGRWIKLDELAALLDLIESMAQRVPLTEEQVAAAARVMNDRQAEVCGVDKDDQWKIYSDDFKDDARAMLEAAHGIRSEK
jgi:hypothetical protein